MEQITFCKKNDLNNLISFLKKNWINKDTKFKNIKFFKWFYFNKKFKKYNFVIIKKNNLIKGCLGFYVNDNYYKNVIWLSFWLIDQKNRENFDGLSLLNFLKLKFKNSIFATTGMNHKTIPIYKILGFRVLQLKHFYFVNPFIRNFKLAMIKKTKVINIEKNNYNLTTKNKIDFLKNNKMFKINKKLYLKDVNYIIKKYQVNPFYKYNFYIIHKKKTFFGFFVGRESNFKKKKALRFVEFFGNQTKIPLIKKQLLDLIKLNNYEYIDFYNYGISNKNLSKAGFILNNYNDDVIIPNYYQPFIKKNIKLNLAFSPPHYKLLVFKGDGDQDRPNF